MPLQGVQVTPGAGPPILTRLLPDGTYIQQVQLQLTGDVGTDLVLLAGPRLATESISVVWASDAPPIDVIIPAGFATETTQLSVLAELTAIGQDTAALITGQDAGNAILTSILGAVDTLEAGQATANTHLNAIKGFVDGLEAGQAAGNATLVAIQGYVDTLEAGQATANALLTDIKANTGAGGAVPPATSAVTAVPAAVANTLLLAANANRKGATVYNDSSAELLLRLGTPASAAAFTLSLLPGSYYEVPYGYTGRIDGLWAAATGNARVTELTP